MLCLCHIWGCRGASVLVLHPAVSQQHKGGNAHLTETAGSLGRSTGGPPCGLVRRLWEAEPHAGALCPHLHCPESGVLQANLLQASPNDLKIIGINSLSFYLPENVFFFFLNLRALRISSHRFLASIVFDEKLAITWIIVPLTAIDHFFLLLFKFLLHFKIFSLPFIFRILTTSCLGFIFWTCWPCRLVYFHQIWGKFDRTFFKYDFMLPFLLFLSSETLLHAYSSTWYPTGHWGSLCFGLISVLSVLQIE